MATVWLTYAWADNENQDVDYAAQELRKVGLDVKIDRLVIRAGERLWPQIEAFIQDPSHSDAWVLYATQNGLGSERCREELAYALDRALRTADFPIIGLFPGTVDHSLIPAAIRTRLFGSLKESDWQERIAAAAEGREPSITVPTVDPYEVIVYPSNPQFGDSHYAIEARPRAGTWYPVFIGIPADERNSVQPSLAMGPRGNPGAMGSVLRSTREWQDTPPGTPGVEWWIKSAGEEATPTQSCFIRCTELPSKIAFGAHGPAGPAYLWTFDSGSA